MSGRSRVADGWLLARAGAGAGAGEGERGTGGYPGIYFLTQTFVGAAAAVCEDLSFGAALGRSVWLTRRHRGDILGILVLGLFMLAPPLVLFALAEVRTPLPGLTPLSWAHLTAMLAIFYMLGVTQGVVFETLARIKADRPDLEAEHTALYFRGDGPPPIR